MKLGFQTQRQKEIQIPQKESNKQTKTLKSYQKTLTQFHLQITICGKRFEMQGIQTANARKLSYHANLMYVLRSNIWRRKYNLGLCTTSHLAKTIISVAAHCLHPTFRVFHF